MTTGSWRFRYDPGIAQESSTPRRPPTWTCAASGTRVHGPVLVIRGEHSDLLLAETLDEMCKRPHTERSSCPTPGTRRC